MAGNPLPGQAAKPAKLGPARAVALAATPMTFHRSVVDATATYNDLYEPAITVSSHGAIYVSGHTAGADTLRSMAFVSRDDGASWSKLPDVGQVALPIAEGVGQGDEGILAADDQGHAWLYDSSWIVGTSFLYEWCDDGAQLCHVDPLAYDVQQSLAGACGPRTIDKPWLMYGHGELVMTNNGPGTGLNPDTQLQLGLWNATTNTPDWNTCAGQGGRPGIPAIRDADGLFAAPQAQGPESAPFMAITYGTDVHHLRVANAFPTFGDWVSCNAFNGASAFSHAGTYYVAGASTADVLTVAASADMENYTTTSLRLDGTLYFAWMTGSPHGEGALLTWAVAAPGDCLHPTFYAAHVGFAQGHDSGNGVGPDGRAYLAIFESAGACLGPEPEAFPGTHRPVKVYVQDGGPTL
jgi:hypothetical protein